MFKSFTFKSLMLAIVATGTLGMGSAFAGTNGDTVNVTYYFPDNTSIYMDMGTHVVSGLGATYTLPGYFDLHVTDTQIFADNFAFDSSWNTTAFNGFKVTDLTKNFSATYSVDGSNTMAGLTAGNITYGGNSISVNWGGLNFATNTVAVLNVSAVPEPDTYAMLFAGLGLLGFMARRKSA